MSRKRKLSDSPTNNDEDYYICWDFLSAKGCLRDNCQWTHAQPKNKKANTNQYYYNNDYAYERPINVPITKLNNIETDSDKKNEEKIKKSKIPEYTFIKDPKTGGLVYAPISKLTEIELENKKNEILKNENNKIKIDKIEIKNNNNQIKNGNGKFYCTWLYPILDKKRNSFLSFTEGQISSSQLNLWFYNCKNDVNWNLNEIPNRKHFIGNDKPFVLWYTKQGCCCTLKSKKCPQDETFTNLGWPEWLDNMLIELKKLLAFSKKNIIFDCCELIYFNKNDQGWDWHNDITGNNTGLFKNHIKKRNYVTMHLFMTNNEKSRKLFKFSPKRTGVNWDDKETAINVKNGDIFLTSGNFMHKYMIKIEPNLENKKYYEYCYVIWRSIINHFPTCKFYNT